MITLYEVGRLTLEQIAAVSGADLEAVKLDAGAKENIQARRRAAENEIGDGGKPDERPIYGFNRGFGSNVRYALGDEDGEKPTKEKRQAARRALQKNLILSHAANVGPLAPREVVRATMLLRAQSLAVGRSTVRLEVVEKLVELLNKNIIPAVPRYGSVSASGDLSPLSHIAAVMIGEGRIMLDGEAAQKFGATAVETKTYLTDAKKHGLPKFKPLILEMKEGLALNNGCQWSTAWGALTALRMERLIETAALTTALGVQAMLASGRPYRKDFHDLRPHRGSQSIAQWIDALLDGYHFRDCIADEKVDFDGELQAPYNLRCAPQILGPCLELIERAKATLTTEANSVTDNPIDLSPVPEEFKLDLITSGGHFHGMPVAVDVYGLLQAAGIMARLANMRCVRYVDSERNKDLGPQIRGRKPKATESGLLIAEYTTAGLCNHIWGLAMPSHLMSLSTDSGQEDHVSMAANVAMRAYEASARLAEILAIELVFASQAFFQRETQGSVTTRELTAALEGLPPTPDPKEVDWRGSPTRKVTVKFKREWETPLPKGVQPGRLTKKAIAAIRETFPLVASDRELGWNTMALAERVLSGEIVGKTDYKFKRH